MGKTMFAPNPDERRVRWVLRQHGYHLMQENGGHSVWNRMGCVAFENTGMPWHVIQDYAKGVVRFAQQERRVLRRLIETAEERLGGDLQLTPEEIDHANELRLWLERGRVARESQDVDKAVSRIENLLVDAGLASEGEIFARYRD